MERVTAVMIGAGMRGGEAYATYALENPSELVFVAVAEPVAERRALFRALHHIPDDSCFETWQQMMEQPRLAEAAFICTQDDDHFRVSLQAMAKGYHILLEKPMSNHRDECVKIAERAGKCGRVLSVCHVLRYTPFFMKIKELLGLGVIGDIVTVEHSENVAYWHQAHSFVRGNWRNSKLSSPMILAKSCHDLDILNWLIGRRCLSLSSFGSLMFFKKENAPKGAPARCLDGCPARYDCAFYAPKIYIDWQGPWQANVIRRAISQDTSAEGLRKALREGPYGRCVFHCDNDVVDHQVVGMEYEGGITASFTMCAFTYDETRKIRILGTKGELSGDMTQNRITYIDFLTGATTEITLHQSGEGHGGGDHGIVRDFIRAVQGDGDCKSSAGQSLESHLMAFAAEEARLTGRVVTLGNR